MLCWQKYFMSRKQKGVIVYRRRPILCKPLQFLSCRWTDPSKRLTVLFSRSNLGREHDAWFFTLQNCSSLLRRDIHCTCHSSYKHTQTLIQNAASATCQHSCKIEAQPYNLSTYRQPTDVNLSLLWLGLQFIQSLKQGIYIDTCFFLCIWWQIPRYYLFVFSSNKQL